MRGSSLLHRSPARYQDYKTQTGRGAFHLGSLQQGPVVAPPQVVRRELVRRPQVCRQSPLSALHKCDTVAGWQLVLKYFSNTLLRTSLTDLFGKCSENGVAVDEILEDGSTVVLPFLIEDVLREK